MKKLIKVLEITFTLLSLSIPLILILYIWEIVIGILFCKIIFTNLILWVTILIVGLYRDKIEESEKQK